MHTFCGFFFFFCVFQLDLWGSPFWVRFLSMRPFSNPTIEVVTFSLHGSCMLGVFLLPAFTRLGHESQDLLSPCDGMHRLDLGFYSHLKEFGGMESEPMLTPREKNPLYWGLRGGLNPCLCITLDSEPNTLTSWAFFFFFFFFWRSPALSLGFTTFGWDFCVCDRFFNPTKQVVTFRLRGWCVLGVFLLPAFTRLGHERQDLLSPCDEMHVCTD